MDGEDGLRGNMSSTSDLITIQVENGTTYIKFDSLPLGEDAKSTPSVDGTLARKASIRAISIRLITSSSSLTPSPTGTEEPVSVTIEFFIKKTRDGDFEALLLEGSQKAKVRMRNILT